jgi:hypothetical protein
MFKVSGDRIDRRYIDEWVPRLDVGEEWQLVLQRISG